MNTELDISFRDVDHDIEGLCAGCLARRGHGAHDQRADHAHTDMVKHETPLFVVALLRRVVVNLRFVLQAFALAEECTFALLPRFLPSTHRGACVR